MKCTKGSTHDQFFPERFLLSPIHMHSESAKSGFNTKKTVILFSQKYIPNAAAAVVHESNIKPFGYTEQSDIVVML
jgi:hypothetical protein